MAVRFGDEGLAALTHPGVVLAALAIGALTTAGLLFTQRSYRSGLGAPLAVSTLANPVAATLIGVLLLDEQITAGTPGALLALTCAACATYGVTLLTPSPTRPPAPSPAPAPLILELSGDISGIRT